MIRIWQICVAILLLAPSIFAQDIDTNSVMSIENVYKVTPKELEFDIYLKRTSDTWVRWTNATMQLKLNDTLYKISPDSLELEYIPTPELGFAYISKPLPVDKYSVTTIVYEGRFSIYVVGPESFNDAMEINNIEPTFIGKFKLKSTKGNLPKGDSTGLHIQWCKPYSYYQAIAYKTDKVENKIDSTEIVPDDNYDFGDSPTSKGIVFLDDVTPQPSMKLIYFNVRYIGGFRTSINWEMASEKDNNGYLLTRAVLPFGKRDYSKSNFTDTLAYYVRGTDPNYLRDTAVRGKGTTVRKTNYSWPYDTVKFRGQNYVYKLSYRNFNDSIVDLTTTPLLVPNATIESAQANPNPFERQTSIEYTVNDNVNLTAKVYDLNGKLVKTIFENQFTRIGSHTMDLSMPEFATQGLYDLRFIANPINDESVEDSRASVRLTMIR